MTTVSEVIRKKGSDIYSIVPDASVLDAMKLMDEANTGALLVMAGDRVEGIVSERDCVRKVDVQGRSSRDTKVREIMTEKVMYVNPSQPLEELMVLMTEKNIRHMPVFDGDKLLGVISMRDVLREVAAEQKFLISQLEYYIKNG